MISNIDDIRRIRPVSENIDDENRMVPYLKEVELNKTLKYIGAHLYRQFDNVYNNPDYPNWPGVTEIDFNNTAGNTVTITKDQFEVILSGGYYRGCGCAKEEHTRGLKEATVYLAYETILWNANVNITAFGAREQKLVFSNPLDEATIARAANQAQKEAYSILWGVKEYLKALNLIDCCGGGKPWRPEKFKRLSNHPDLM